MRTDIPINLKTSIALMGTCSIYSLYLAEGNIPLLIGAVCAIWISSFWNASREYFDEEGMLAKIFPAFSVALMICDYLYLSGKIVLALSHFLILYEIFLFSGSKSEKKIWQIYLVTFLTVAVAASITDDFYFSLSFVLYLFSFLYSISLFRICAEGTSKLREKRKIISGDSGAEYNFKRYIRLSADKEFSLVVVTAFIVTVIFSSFFFLTLPRIGLGFMLSRIGGATGVAGFSETSKIGDIGEVLENRNIVMRLRTDKPLSESQLRMRGIAYDLFRGNIWKRSRMFNRFYKPFYSGKVNFPVRRIKSSGSAVVQSVTLALSGSDALFSLYYPVSVQNLSGGYRGILGDNSMSFFTPWPHYYLLNYEVSSIPAEDILFGELTPVEKMRYLDIKGLDERVKKLALSIAGGEGGLYDKAKKIENYLSANFRYSRSALSVEKNKDPLVNFLFEKKQGHCEYFATALTLMCRAAGIPSRYVNGFYGGEWNSYGSYYIVRQENAHSWTEVFIPERGWVYLDATPPLAGRQPVKSFLSTIGLFIDNIKMSWGKYVVGYDLNMQFKGAQKLNLGASKWMRKIKEFRKNFLRGLSFQVNPGYVFPFLVILLIVLSLLAFRKVKFKKAKKTSIAFYDDLIKIFRKSGYLKPDCLTGYEFINSIEGLNDVVVSESRELVGMFYRIRYGQKTISEKDNLAVGAKLKRIEKIMKDLG